MNKSFTTECGPAWLLQAHFTTHGLTVLALDDYINVIYSLNNGFNNYTNADFSACCPSQVMRLESMLTTKRVVERGNHGVPNVCARIFQGNTTTTMVD